MKEHLSDCSPHYACLCVTLREKGSEPRGRECRAEYRGGLLNAYTLFLSQTTYLL